MSAWIVDPRTIDYLVTWVQLQGYGADAPQVWLRDGHAIPATWQGAVDGSGLYLIRVDRDALGQLLMAENVRSVRARYPNDTPDTLPGPCNLSRVYAYRFRAVPAGSLRPDWVVKAVDCWRYQTCETEDHASTLAWQVSEAIRESAIYRWTKGAPWGIGPRELGEAA